MKKQVIILGLASCMLAFPLTTMGIGKSGMSCFPTVKAASNYSQSEYALMAYLKLTGVSSKTIAHAKHLTADGGMELTQKGNTYTIGFGAHSTDMIVDADTVTVVYDAPTSEGMGNRNASKTYSKSMLANKYGKDKGNLDLAIKHFNLTDDHGSASEKLDYQTITPMQTAAAIAYYGQSKIGKGAWRGLNNFGSLGLTQLDNADHLAVKGRGNSWYLSPKNMNGGTSAAYTVGADGTVAFYTVKTVDKDEEHEPQATVNLHSIIQYVNQQHAVEQVKGIARQIHLNE